MRAEKCRHDFQTHLLLEFAHNAQNFQFIFDSQTVAQFRFDCRSSATQEPVRMLFCLREKTSLASCTRFFYGRPNSAACLRNLLVRFTSCPAFEVLEPIACENQMRMRIDEPRHYNASIGIDNFCVANILFDLIAGADSLDLAVADEHSTIRNDPEFRQLWPNARALGSAQRDELRGVEDRERVH